MFEDDDPFVRGGAAARETQTLLVERFCMFCGISYRAPLRRAEYCSSTCQQKEWRARAMLAGTHGYLNGKWQRLP